MIVTNKISIFNLLPKGQRRPWHPPLTAPLGTDWHSRQELGTPAWAWWDQDPGVAGAAAGLRSCPLLGDVTRPCPRIGRRSRAGWSPLPSLVGVGTAGASPPWALTPRWLKEPRREGGLQLPPHRRGQWGAQVPTATPAVLPRPTSANLSEPQFPLWKMGTVCATVRAPSVGTPSPWVAFPGERPGGGTEPLPCGTPTRAAPPGAGRGGVGVSGV